MRMSGLNVVPQRLRALSEGDFRELSRDIFKKWHDDDSELMSYYYPWDVCQTWWGLRRSMSVWERLTENNMGSVLRENRNTMYWAFDAQKKMQDHIPWVPENSLLT